MKKILIGVVALLVITVGIFVFVLSSLDGIVKRAIETYGSKATRTQVSVYNVKIKVKSGEGAIRGLNVANPKGFSDPDIFKLGMISMKINTDTVMKNPIIIDTVTIRSPEIFYEINKSGVSNVDVLKKNLAGAGGASGSAGKSDKGKPLKMIIRKLVVEGGKASVRIAALGGKVQHVNIPRIQLTDVGKKSGGATAAEVARILGKRLVKSVKNSVAKLGVRQYLGKSADLFRKGALGKAGKIGGNLGNTIGGAAGNVGGALKGLLGK
ncbi:MAG: hypothetical protein Q9M27_04140 [Mariprofundaceae bacterium]|nr:hypothetical protein [Mariprofundaceae bacterium]